MNRKNFIFSFFFVALFVFYSCGSTKYFYDKTSAKRQKELKSHRSGNVFSDIGLTIASIFVLAAVDVDLGLYPPNGRQFKKMKLINPSKDTIYVNMLADVYWDEDNYCDFLDIRIPPQKKCKVLVPTDSNYNLYFSSTPESDDDELIVFYTNDLDKISLCPGMTINPDTTNMNQNIEHSEFQ